MILHPLQIGSRRPVGGASEPVYYPKTGSTNVGTVGLDYDAIRSVRMNVPNNNVPQLKAPGSALIPQLNT